MSDCNVSAARGFDLREAERKFVTSGDLLFVALLTSCHAINSPNLEC